MIQPHLLRIGFLLVALTMPRLSSAEPQSSFGALPLTFEVNQGQIDAEVKFVSRFAGRTVFLGSTNAMLFSGNSALRIRLLGTSPDANPLALAPVAGRVSYLIGDSKNWHTNIPLYSRIKYAQVYSGIDLIYYGNQRQLECDFIVTPKADPKKIVLALDGAEKVVLEADGSLVAYTPGGQVRLQKPIAYQDLNGRRKEIAACFTLDGNNHASFLLGDYDISQALVIDPVLVFSTYFGGDNDFLGEAGFGIAVDSSSNVYLTGFTQSPSFPTTNAFQSALNGSSAAFVTKLDSTGTNLIYSTYLAGNGTNIAHGIAVDASGSVYLVGETTSTNFPITSSAVRTNLDGASDAFVTKLSPAGTNLVFSTYLGGSGDEVGFAVAIDSSNNVYVTGLTGSTNFPTTSAFQTNLLGQSDVFVTKLGASGTNFIYSTYLGGNSDEIGFGIAWATNGSAYITGETRSDDFPTKNPLQPDLDGAQPFGVGQDAFVTKLGPAGTNLIFSTYIGGRGNEIGEGIALDPAGNVYVAGKTDSDNFPKVRPLQKTLNRGDALAPVTDAFVSKLSPEGTNFVYSTYLGGSRNDTAFAIAIDTNGNAYVTGETDSGNFPLVKAFQLKCRGCDSGFRDAFLTKIGPAGTNAVYSTFLGGGGDDLGFAIALDVAGNAYVTGATTSGQFPRAHPLQVFLRGDADAFVSKIADVEVHDLAVNRIKAPRRVKLTTGGSLTSLVSVQIQNRSQHSETIPDIGTLTNLVSLTVTSVGTNCVAPTATLHVGRPQRSLPVELGPKKTLSVVFDVTFNCANNPLVSTNGDFRFAAAVNHAALPGAMADSHPDDDNCPHSVAPPFEIDPNPDGTIKDKGCGGRKSDRTLGADVLTDIVVK